MLRSHGLADVTCFAGLACSHLLHILPLRVGSLATSTPNVPLWFDSWRPLVLPIGTCLRAAGHPSHPQQHMRSCSTPDSRRLQQPSKRTDCRTCNFCRFSQSGLVEADAGPNECPRPKIRHVHVAGLRLHASSGVRPTKDGAHSNLRCDDVRM